MWFLLALSLACGEDSKSNLDWYHVVSPCEGDGVHDDPLILGNLAAFYAYQEERTDYGDSYDALYCQLMVDPNTGVWWGCGCSNDVDYVHVVIALERSEE